MGYNGLCLFGFGRWPAMGNYWKVRRLAENIRLEIRKILDIDGIINFGDGRAHNKEVDTQNNDITPTEKKNETNKNLFINSITMF